MSAGWPLLFGLALLGCSDQAPAPPPTTTYQPLVFAEDWSRVEREDDPFVSAAEPGSACVGPGFVVESGWVEVDTGLCQWVTLEAGARFGVEPAQALRLVVSHYDLSAIAPAEATVSLRFGDCTLWEKIVAIPNPAAVYGEELESPCSLERGGRVFFHVHNHGQNNWQLQELSALR